MNKWIHPFGLFLIALMAINLVGCVQTKEWLAQIPTKKSKDKKLDEEIASTSKDTRGKDKKLKSSKELASSKTARAKAAGNKKKTAKSQNDDDDDETLASKDQSKNPARPKSAVERSKQDFADKSDSATAKSKLAVRNYSDDLDLIDTSKMKKSRTAAVAKIDSTEEVDPFEEIPSSPDEKLVQVKKDIVEDDPLNFDDEKPKAKRTAVTTASIAESFEDELESPVVTPTAPESESPMMTESTTSMVKDDDSNWTDDLADTSSNDTPITPAKKKAADDTKTNSIAKNDSTPNSGQGMLPQCPKADGELRELLISMNSNDVDSLRNGLYRMGQIPKAGPVVASFLKTMIKHEDAFVRAHTALAMVRLGLVSDAPIKIVAESLKNQDPALRSFGAQILDEMGPETNQVLSALSKYLKDPDGHVRIHAAELLITYEEWSYPALQTLLGCLKDKDENIRWLTTYSLADLQPQSTEAVQALIKASHDPSPKVQIGAVYALGSLGPIAKRARPDLRRLAETTKNGELKQTIEAAIQQLESEAESS